MKAAILIGGQGTRLRPFTLDSPKPLLPVLNRPFLEYQFRVLRQHGVREVVGCTSYRAEDFRRAFGTGRRLNLKLSYVRETIPLGTGGALKNAEKHLSGGTALILNGDVLNAFDIGAFLRFHRARRAEISNRAVAGQGQADALRPGPHRREGLRAALPRKALVGRSRDQHHQRRRLPFRAVGVLPSPRRQDVLPGARIVPGTAGRGREAGRLGGARLLDRHRQRGEVPSGPPRHFGRPHAVQAGARHALAQRHRRRASHGGRGRARGRRSRASPARSAWAAG